MGVFFTYRLNNCRAESLTLRKIHRRIVKMRARIIFCMVAVLAIFSSRAADIAKEIFPGTPVHTIMVEYFNAGYGVSDRQFYYVDILRNAAFEGLKESRRVNVLDAGDDVELRAADGNRGTAEGIYRRYQRMQDLGADMALECDIQSIQAHPEKNRRDRWVGEVGYILRLVDTSTGKVFHKEVYDAKRDCCYGDTPEKALEACVNKMRVYVKVMMLDNVLVEGQILQLIREQKDEAKDVAVNVGKENGAYKGAKFDVYAAESFLNEMSFTKIGAVKIEEVKGDRASLAKTIKGGKKILEAMKKGTPLKIVSYKSGFSDFF